MKLRNRALQDLDQDIREHIEAETQDNIVRGMAPDEARFAAIRKFGNTTQIKESTREVWSFIWFEQLVQDVQYGLRVLRKNPGFTLVAVLTLALGIGANTAMFSIADAVLWSTMPYPHPEQLVVAGEVSLKNPDNSWGVTYPTFRDWQSRSTSFEHLAAILYDSRILRDGPEPVRITGAAVTYDYFEVMGVQPEFGRVISASDDTASAEPVVVLSHRMWAERFNSDPAIVGRAVHMPRSTGINFTAIGVMPAGFDNGQTDYWIPVVRIIPPNFATRRDVWVFKTVGRLRPGYTAAQAQVELEGITARIRSSFPEAGRGLVVHVDSLRASMSSDLRPALLVLLGAVGLVLLIACANLAALISVRAAGRGRELAVRAALGASRARLVAQLLTESALLSFIGGAAGVALAYWATRSLAQLSKDPRLLHATISLPVLLFALGAAALTSVLAGVAPAMQHSRDTLNSRTSGLRRRARLQQSLVISEVALCLVLLIGAGLLFRSLRRVLDVDPGFRADHLLTMRVSLPPIYTDGVRILQFYRAVPERLQSLPGISGASLVSWLPVAEGEPTGDITIEGRPSVPGANGGASFRRTLPGYFRMMGIPLVRGREFDDRDDGAHELVVIINERMARNLWPNESDDPIGKRIKIGPPQTNPWLTIVGVVKDVHHTGLSDPIGMSIYDPLAQGVDTGMDLAVRTGGDPAAAISAVRGELHRIEPAVLIDRVATMGQRIEDSVSPRKLNLFLFGLFSGLALLLASIGLYGVVAYSVGQRAQEFGIRMAMGAQRRDIFQLVLRQGMALTVAGLALGLITAAAFSRFLASLLFQVKAFDLITYAGVTLLLAGVALLACCVPSLRATRVDPLVTLRNE